MRLAGQRIGERVGDGVAEQPQPGHARAPGVKIATKFNPRASSQSASSQRSMKNGANLPQGKRPTQKHTLSESQRRRGPRAAAKEREGGSSRSEQMPPTHGCRATTADREGGRFRGRKCEARPRKPCPWQQGGEQGHGRPSRVGKRHARRAAKR